MLIPSGHGAARLAFAVGAAADAFWAVALFVPPIFGLLTGNPGFRPDADVRSIMSIGGLLMLGWTVLLLWGYRRPIERRFLLLLTACVVLGLSAVALMGVLRGDPAGLWILGKTTVLVVLMGYGYVATGR